MLSIERIKELIPEENFSDEEAEGIRNSFRVLAEIIFEQWQEEQNKKSKIENHG